MPDRPRQDKHVAKLVKLAHWPRDLNDSVRDYLRILLRALLSQHSRLLLEATLILFSDSAEKCECMVRLSSATYGAKFASGEEAIEWTAAGATPEVAYLNAALFAIRRAVLGADVPVLGRLLGERNLSVDLEVREGHSIYDGRYILRVHEDRREVAWIVPMLPEGDYELTVSVRKGKRTQYLVIDNLKDAQNAPLEALVSPNMRVTSTILVHRFLLALGGRVINDLKNLNDLRCSLDLEPFEEDLRHGHHLNGWGLDNRIENLRPLTPREHAKEHDIWFTSYDDLSKGLVDDAESKIVILKRIRPSMIGSSKYFEQLRFLDHLGSDAPFSRPPGATAEVSVGSNNETLRPVTTAEIKAIAGISPSDKHIQYTLSALRILGGQGRFLALKNTKPLAHVPTTTVRDALKRLEGAGIIASCSLSSSGSLGRGAERHFRLLRPLAPDVLRLMRPRPRKAR